MRLIGMFVLITSLATPAVAQDEVRLKPDPHTFNSHRFNSHRLIISDRAIEAGMAEHPLTPPSPPQTRGDSLVNGAIIGAALGGIAMGASGGWICHMLREPGDPPCWKSVLPVAAIAAGIGAGVGAGIDALKARNTRASLRP